MFSEELENLIKATLADGQLTDKEKAALVKRAQREGVDLDELDIYIDSIQQKRVREQKEKLDELEEQRRKEKAQAYGEICPACGKQVPPLTLKCDCGYEFSNRNSVSNFETLSDKINKIIEAPYKSSPGSFEYDEDVKLRDQRIRDLITVAPIPNTKEDIIEFLALSAPNSKHKGWFLGSIMGRLIFFGSIAIILIIAVSIATFEDVDLQTVAILWTAIISLSAGGYFTFGMDKETLRWNKNAKVWRAKFDQALMKARSLKGDSEFSQRIDYYEKFVYGKKGMR